MPDSTFTQQLIARLAWAGLARADELRGFSRHEIAALEAALGHPLPRVCHESLALFGRRAGSFFRGTDLFAKSVEALLDLQAAARTLLAENGHPITLPPATFVFMMHQGYAFYYVPGNDGEDPPVFEYVEPGHHGRVAEHLSTFFLEAADHQAT